MIRFKFFFFLNSSYGISVKQVSVIICFFI